MAFNLVELMTSGEEGDCAFDQPCRFGHRLEGHAVYCHNDAWEDSPRKCRRSWYTGGSIKDEDCPGFQPNPEFKGYLSKSQPPQNPCSKCAGKKLVQTERGKSETCPLCMGSGEQPGPMPLTVYEQDTLEIGTGRGIRGTGHAFIRLAENDEEHASITKLCDADLVTLRSVSSARRARVSAYLLENTMKGEAVMRQNWKASEKPEDADGD